MIDCQQAARDYLYRGWMPLPLPHKSKNPGKNGWQNFKVSEVEIPACFDKNGNIGLLLGDRSHNLVDIDLDCREAVAVAPLLLPATLTSGRDGRPQSHYWYACDPLLPTMQFIDPTKRTDEEGAMIVEFRSTGAQTVVYPSIHPEGDRYVWHGELEPATVGGDRLLSIVRRLAAAALMARHWNYKLRHNTALALAGGLLRAGWQVERAERFIRIVSTAAGDDEIEDRVKTVRYTAERLATEGKATGLPRLAEFVDSKVVDRLVSWLDLQRGSFGGFGTSQRVVREEFEWPEPEPINVGLKPVPPLPSEMLPIPFRDWLSDIADRAQSPLEFCTIGAIVSAASVVGNRIGICPKRHDDWKVIPNLWGAIIGRPGLLKSPSLAEAMRPLNRLAIERHEEHTQAVQSWEIERMVREAHRDRLKAQIKEEVKSGSSINAELLREQLDEIEKTSEPVERRYIVNDPTVEKLGELLNQNPRGLLLFRDELVGWLKSLDKDGHESDRAFYLEAWNGNGRYTYDRIGRGTIHIQSVTLSILGGIQPGPLSQYLRGALSCGACDDGLLQRFQLLVYPDTPKQWRNVDRWPNTQAKNQVFEIFKRLDSFEPCEILAEPDEEDGVAYLRFTDEAQDFFDEWRGELEKELREENGKHPALEAHLAKYRSLMPSLALVFHLLDWADGGGPRGSVTFESAELAAAWCSLLSQHAERVYGIAIDADAILARRLSEHISRGALPEVFSARDVYRKGWAGLGSYSEARGPLELLEDFGWLRSIAIKHQDGGRPTVFYQVNPKIKTEARQ